MGCSSKLASLLYKVKLNMNHLFIQIVSENVPLQSKLLRTSSFLSGPGELPGGKPTGLPQKGSSVGKIVTCFPPTLSVSSLGHVKSTNQKLFSCPLRTEFIEIY